jgi:hypothetical protein
MITVLLLTVVRGTVKAGLIIQTQSNWGYTVKYHMPVGQTFAAEDALIKSIGFKVHEANPHTAFAPIWVNLFEGVGTGGTLLGQAQLDGIEPGYSGFYDADFTSVTLTVGQVYTATLSTTTPRAEVRGTFSEPPPGPYAGGQAIFNGVLYPDRDLAFRVQPAPEPLTPPVADADGPYSIYVGDTLTLDASRSSDANEDIVSYMWDLDDDGSFETDAGGQEVFDVNYAYLESLGLIVGGPFVIHVQVTDSEQQSDTDTSTLTILAPPVIEAVVDIKPRSCPNPLNVKSKGVLPVAILGSATLDVTVIDAGSIFLNGARNVRSGYEDVAGFIADANDCRCTTLGPDGYLDLTLKFKTQDIVATLGEVNRDDVLELQLDGVLYDETPVEGADCVVIRGKHKPFNPADINKDGVVDAADFAVFAQNWLQSSIVGE